MPVVVSIKSHNTIIARITIKQKAKKKMTYKWDNCTQSYSYCTSDAMPKWQGRLHRK